MATSQSSRCWWFAAMHCCTQCSQVSPPLTGEPGENVWRIAEHCLLKVCFKVNGSAFLISEHTARAQCKRTHLKKRRALFTERAWILQSWLLKPITGQTQRDLLLAPTRPCMLRDATAFTRPAGPSLNTVALSHQHTSSCHTVPATALIMCMRM